MVVFSLVLICFLLCLGRWIVERDLSIKRSRRINDVYEYRLDILRRLGIDRLKMIASYEEMLKSEKELTDDNWLK